MPENENEIVDNTPTEQPTETKSETPVEETPIPVEKPIEVEVSLNDSREDEGNVYSPNEKERRDNLKK